MLHDAQRLISAFWSKSDMIHLTTLNGRPGRERTSIFTRFQLINVYKL